MSPGGNSSKLSFEVGRRLRGLPGGVVAYFAMTVPGILFVVTIGSFLLRHVATDAVNGLLRGAQAGVVAMVVMIGVRMAQGSVHRAAAWVLAAVAFALVAVFNAPIFFVVPPLAVLGYLLARRRARQLPASGDGTPHPRDGQP